MKNSSKLCLLLSAISLLQIFSLEAGEPTRGTRRSPELTGCPHRHRGHAPARTPKQHASALNQSHGFGREKSNSCPSVSSSSSMVSVSTISGSRSTSYPSVSAATSMGSVSSISAGSAIGSDYPSVSSLSNTSSHLFPRQPTGLTPLRRGVQRTRCGGQSGLPSRVPSRVGHHLPAGPDLWARAGALPGRRHDMRAEFDAAAFAARFKKPFGDGTLADLCDASCHSSGTGSTASSIRGCGILDTSAGSSSVGAGMYRSVGSSLSNASYTAGAGAGARRPSPREVG